jgi:hypothetical protein
MWSIAERLVKEENSPGVLHGLLTSLQRIAGSAPDKVTGLAVAIYDRFRSHPSAASTRELCIGIFVGLHVWRGQPTCGAILDVIASDPLGHLEEALHIPFQLRDALTQGPVPSISVEDEATRQRAVRLMVTLAEQATAQFLQLRRQFDTGPVAEADQKRAQTLMHLLDGLGSEVYFASGAFKSGQEDAKALAPEVLERFYGELRPVFAALATAGIPSLAHHLLETLEALVEFDPPAVFRDVATVVRGSRGSGYSYESLAAGLIVGLVARYLADYRDIFQSDEGLRHSLIEVLDAFVGWPEAQKLVYRLEDIFR